MRDEVPRYVHLDGQPYVVGTERDMTPNHRCDVYRRPEPGMVGLRIPHAAVLLGDAVATQKVRGVVWLLCTTKATIG